MTLFLLFWFISLAVAHKKDPSSHIGRDVSLHGIRPFLTGPDSITVAESRVLDGFDPLIPFQTYCPEGRVEFGVIHEFQLVPDFVLDRLPSNNCTLYLNHLYQLPYHLIGQVPKITLYVHSEMDLDTPEDYLRRLRHSPWLHSLKLRPLTIEYEYAEAISTALQGHIHLEEFELALSMISGESIVAFIEMISSLPSLQTARFISVDMNNRVFRSLVNGLRLCSSLEELTLQQDFQSITDESQYEFIDMLKTLPLKKLSLQASGDMQLGYGPLSNLLHHDTLEELNLPGFVIDQSHFRNMFRMFVSHPKLKVLNLSQSLARLNDHDFEDALKILSEMNHLEGLVLSWNGENRHVHWSILAQSTSIKSLNLNGNSMNQAFILTLIDAFQGHPTLESLDMTSIPMSMSTKDSIRRIVKNIPHFKSLNGMSLSSLSSRRFSP
jgi:hypothetical protein